jgi:tetratricopeptide (TPR) repeat protein
MHVLLSVLLLAVAAGGRAASGQNAAGYVTDASCAECHREIAASYQRVGMHHSMSRWRDDASIEDFASGTFFHEPSNRHYEMTRRDGAMLIKRFQLDEHDQPINVLEQKVDWIIGSGHHSRGYLYRTPAGELFQLPIVWYTQEGSWGMAPGFDQPDQEDFARPVTRACLFCHNAYPDAAPGSDAFGQPQIFPENLPEGTGCQRCHGPGAAHIRAASDPAATLEQLSASIVNPARLPPARRDDVCNQCHLQPTSKLTSLQRRFGRTDYSFRPGEALADYLVHLDFDDGRDPRDRFEINHHSYRLGQSRCFTESSQALSCLTCHDPHQQVPPQQRAAHFRDKCLTCHAAEACHGEDAAIAATGNDCVACHMPRRRTQDVVHIVMTDHLIQRPPANPEHLLAALDETPPPVGAIARLASPHGDLPQEESALLQAMSTVSDGNLDQLASFAAILEACGWQALEPRVELGVAQLRSGDFASARMTFQALAQAHPHLGLLESNLGVALTGLGMHEEAAAHFKRAVALSPNSPDAHLGLAGALAKLDRIEEATGSFHEAIRLRPHFAKAHFNLGNLLARQRKYAEAAQAFRRALASDPAVRDGYRNLGAALRAMGHWRQAVEAWKLGAAAAPENAGIWYELALASLMAPDESVRQAPEGLRMAQRAAELAPASEEPALALCAALLVNETWDEAIAAADHAARLGADADDCALVSAIAKHHLKEPEKARELFVKTQQHRAGKPPDSRVGQWLLQTAATLFSTP